MPVYQKELKIRHEADICVVGGGPAGVSAAVTAARMGKKVLLIEAMTSLGGLGTHGLVPMFCQFTDGIRFLAGGFGWEIHERCLKEGACSPNDEKDHPHKKGSISIYCEKLKRMYDQIVLEAGVKVLFHTKLCDVIMDGSKVDTLVVSGLGELYGIKAHTYIDCTGNGILSVFAGAEYGLGDEDGSLQACTLCSSWAGIDWETVRANGFHDLWPRNTQFIEKAYEEGVLDTCDLHLSGMWRTGEILGGANAGHVYGIQDTDEEQVTKAFFRGREQVAQYEQYYKRYLKGFEHMECTGTGALLGVRESRRIMCDYVLTREDYMNRAVFEDEIGRYNYNIDIHPPTSSKEDYAQFEKDMKLEMGVGESYGIPYRSLTVKGIENLLVAGKCVSADHAMQASIRVMPGCFITGQAAGCAAAMTEGDGNVRKVDIKALQKNLKAIGAYLPNYKE
ncbi:MAG: FAD-dependent oxidoreductase [Clostridiales bacterium]|nr:FAD-dependent oxidoreductase [Clostridiales bacterium]